MAAPRKSAAKKTAAKKAAAKKAATRRTSAKKAAKKGAVKQPSVRSAAAKARGAAEDISIVVTSRVKQTLNSLEMRMDSDLVHEVNRRVQDMLTHAADRAKSNKRSTVRPHDL